MFPKREVEKRGKVKGKYKCEKRMKNGIKTHGKEGGRKDWHYGPEQPRIAT